MKKSATKNVKMSKAYRQQMAPNLKVPEVLNYPHFSGRQIVISHSSDHLMRGFRWLALVYIRKASVDGLRRVPESTYRKDRLAGSAQRIRQFDPIN
jgi:hypothetical protein